MAPAKAFNAKSDDRRMATAAEKRSAREFGRALTSGVWNPKKMHGQGLSAFQRFVSASVTK